MTVLCLVEYDDAAAADGAPGGSVADASLRTLTLARDLAQSAGGEVAAVLFVSPAAASPDPGDPAAAVPEAVLADLAAYGVATAWAVRAGAGYAPAAWARGLAELAVTCAAAAVVAAATDRGSEVLAHLGAITGQPVAANTVSARFVSPGLC